MLVFSLMTATATQLSANTLNIKIDIEDSKIPTIEFVVVVEEKDAPFDFDTAHYLPVGFNATLILDTAAYNVATIEEDAPFDFESANHLPIGFNATLVLDTDEYEEATIEEDAVFDFNTADYLPVPCDA